MTLNDDDSLDAVKDVIEAIDTLIGFTASGRQRNRAPRWEKVTLRPVALKDVIQYQASYFDGTQDVTQNFALDELQAPLDEILGEGFSNFHAQSEDGDLHVRITKRGKVLISRGRPSLTRSQRHLQHNRTRQHLLTPENGAAVLQAIGITDGDGRIKPTMQAKFRQVNAFLRLLNDRIDDSGVGPIRMVDCGCGSAYLTLSAYAFLAEVQKRDVTLTGVDRNESLIAKCTEMARALGWDGVTFESCGIGDYQPKQPPNVVLSLHACDLATDEALAQAVHWGADLILAAPCCQQELSGQVASDLHASVLKHGILKQRTADILTDSMRAQLLQISGYRTEVIEFISSEETSKNLMIRAQKLSGAAEERNDVEAVARSYQALKAFWHVAPSLETYLGSTVSSILGDESASITK
jgi:hypothetical protein